MSALLRTGRSVILQLPRSLHHRAANDSVRAVAHGSSAACLLDDGRHPADASASSRSFSSDAEPAEQPKVATGLNMVKGGAVRHSDVTLHSMQKRLPIRFFTGDRCEDKASGSMCTCGSPQHVLLLMMMIMQDPQLMADSEYPSWLWQLAEPRLPLSQLRRAHADELSFEQVIDPTD